MCLSPEMFCCGCLMESFGQLLRYPVEEIENGLRLCSKHKLEYLAKTLTLNFPAVGGGGIAVPPSQSALPSSSSFIRI